MGALARLREHPRGFWFVFSGELAERASYYGMRTVLALYLFDKLGYSPSGASSVVQGFMALVYLLPLAGGYIADHYLGRFKTIFYFSFPYIAGHFILGELQTRPFMFLALSLLVLGSGAIKPSCSPLMAMIYEKERKTDLLPEAFSYYYLAINIGSMCSSWAVPALRTHYGYKIALMAPTLLMALALEVITSGRRYYPVENPRERPPKTDEQRRVERKSLRNVLGVFAVIVFFWFVYDQSASTWVFFAKDHMDLNLWPGRAITPDQVQALNPFFIIVLIPLFNALWRWRKRLRGGVEVPATQRMMLGFVVVFACMVIMAVAGFAASGPAKVSVWLEIFATLVMAFGELCISTVGLEFAYMQSPPSAKSAITAAFLSTVFFGDALAVPFVQLYDRLPTSSYFALQAGISLVVSIVFYFVAKHFESAVESLTGTSAAA
jgi:POT family proton-dependent oligopeptide transporter